MATTLNPPLAGRDKKPRLGGRGPGGRRPVGDGDWGGGRDDGRPEFGDRLRRYRIGVVVGLTPILMLFVAFTSAYIVRQGLGSWDAQTGSYVSDWRSLALPPLLWVNTVILVVSSLTLELARRSAGTSLVRSEARALGLPVGARESPWLPVTVVLGFAFLAGQVMAWRQLAARGVFMSTNPSSSFFYLLTGAHAVHLLGGVVALLFAALTAAGSDSWQRRRLVIDVTSWYWHFMALLWLYIFALLHFAK